MDTLVRVRYVIQNGDGDDTYCRQVHDRGPLGDKEHNMIGPNFTEAEAGIAAFALNAVARGARLYLGFEGNEVLTAYDGPTEGIAP